MRTYFAYIRVSTARQGEHGSSLQEQRRAIETYAARQHLVIAEWFEEKETAAKQGRAVFSRMLAKLAQGIAHGVVIHKIDRSARNLKDWANLGDLIDRGIDVHFAHDSVDLRSRGGRLSADIQAVVAADYIRNLREEVVKGLRGRLNQGVYPFYAPVGYLNTGKGAAKAIDPVRAPLVQQAFELYATGTVGLKDLRKEMKARGLTMPRTGEPLSLNGISKVLNNPFYIGLMRVKTSGETYQGKHDPLIAKALFDRVQLILKGKLVVRVSKHDFLFRRMICCETCTHHLIGENHDRRFTYYRCHNCRGTSVREMDIDHALQMLLSMLTWDARERAAAIKIAAEMEVHREEDFERERTSLVMRIARCDERLTVLTDALLDRTIDKEMYERRKSALLADQRDLRDRLEKLPAAGSMGERALENLEIGNAALHGYKTGITPEKRDIVSSVTSKLSIQGKNLEIALKSPYQEIANWRKVQLSAHAQGTPRENAKQLLDFVLTLSQEEKNDSVAKKREEDNRKAA